MSFDKPTRNLLAKTVAACRERLAADITDQLQSAFGLYPDGTQLDVARTEAERRAADDLRALRDHYLANLPASKDAPQLAFRRLVRDAGFTLLNRLAALRLCEERGLVIECVRQGMESDGFRLFDMLANGALGNRYQTYRVFLERMFDELARDLGALFDRGNPLSQVFPSEAALTEVLGLLNQPDLAQLWRQDETIGWMYQYYNDPAERKKMREESQAPRNSRELAVRNQFFTPRYVVEFLTDNTLGRLWLEMRGGESVLTGECRYLVSGGEVPGVRRQAAGGDESGADDPGLDSSPKSGIQPGRNPNPQFPISNYRARKDPRDLKILDPACGSGHFLLYSFDLLVLIYEEAWADPDLPPFSESGTWLAQEYPSLEELRRALPELILRHNLYGVDIDPRAAQIAALALWLRAQRAWQAWGVPAGERPQVRKTNVVVAEPMPGDARLLDEFLAELEALPFIKQLVRVIFEKMKLAGEAGSLLKIEADLREAIAAAKQQWLTRPQAEQMSLWAEPARPQARQLGMFDLSGIADEQFWKEAEGRALEALREYARRAENGKGTRRKLFAGEAEMGFAFVDLCLQRFDVVLMNPPFGLMNQNVYYFAVKNYPYSYSDFGVAFMDRGYEILADDGKVGAITSRSYLAVADAEKFRTHIAIPNLEVVVDLGLDVMDDAWVDSSCQILSNNTTEKICFVNFREKEFSPEELSKIETHIWRNRLEFLNFPKARISYAISSELEKLLTTENDGIESSKKAIARAGATTFEDERFRRLIWEIDYKNIGKDKLWCFFAKSSEFNLYYYPYDNLVKWNLNGNELAERNIQVNGQTAQARQGSDFYFIPGLSFSRRGEPSIAFRIHPSECIFSSNGVVVLPANSEEIPYFLGLLNSSYVRAAIHSLSHKFSYSVGHVKSVRWVLPSVEQKKVIVKNAENIFCSKRNRFMLDERDHFFSGLDLNFVTISESANKTLGELARNEQNNIELMQQIDSVIAQTYEIDTLHVKLDEYKISPNDVTDPADVPFGNVTDYVKNVVSYLLGLAFGRWDYRIGKNIPSLSKIPNNIYSPLPICPPSMLLNSVGLPATSSNVVSEAWLRARPDAITLPEMRERDGQTFVVLDGQEHPATIPDSDYPLPVPWDGILVDDPGLDGKSPHPADLVERVRHVLRLLWPENHSAIEAEACEILGVRDLREYFRKPGGFFADHLKRYSKSRRQAPIYWPLSTASGAYTLWLYYPRLTAETLPTALNRFVDPKIAEVSDYVAALEVRLNQISGRAATDLRDQLDAQKSLLSELRDFRVELLRISALPYQPDLNDGVILNAAPFHRLFRLSKWSKDTESAWKKLQNAEYEWSHIAYVTWPERVREACKTDKSIAIAHGLESLYVEVEGKKVKGKKKKGVEEEEE